MKIKEEILNQIVKAKHKAYSGMRNELAEALGKNRITVWRKLKTNHSDLTKAACIAIIAKHLNLPKSKILTNVR